MSEGIDQHQIEIERNKAAWNSKGLLRAIYAGFYGRIKERIDAKAQGAIVELGSGIGNLKGAIPEAVCTDLFPNPWLDLVCDGYELPFADRSISNLILFDVFHHLEAPFAFLKEAGRAVSSGGRIILFEPYISLLSHGVYGLLHHEPVGWKKPINRSEVVPSPRPYHAAQGNATRLFFGKENLLPSGWAVEEREVFASFAYLLSGGFSKSAVYPASAREALDRVDKALSGFPKIFGARCLVTLKRVV